MKFEGTQHTTYTITLENEEIRDFFALIRILSNIRYLVERNDLVVKLTPEQQTMLNSLTNNSLPMY